MLVVIKGAGDIASGIALRLHHAHMQIIMTETAAPTAIRRTVCFSSAVALGTAAVEDASALLAHTAQEANSIAQSGNIAVLVDPAAHCIKALQPDVVVDAILAKTNTGTAIFDAPVVVGVGPGFCAGQDCHAVVETQRGHTLGRVITAGTALENTGIPGNIGGYTTERVLRAPVAGVFCAQKEIGAQVQAGELIATVDGEPVYATITGTLRGILKSDMRVVEGMKCGDIDPRCELAHWYTVSDKALAVGGGVLEAILRFGANR